MVLGRPRSREASGGGGAARGVAAGLAAVARVVAARAFGFAAAFLRAADFVALAFAAEDFVALAFAFGFVALDLVPGDFVALAFVAVPVVAAVPRRSPPIRDTRVERRLPRTLGSDDGLAAAFFVFFFAVFSAMRKKVARARVPTGYSDAATRSVTAPVQKK